VRKSDFTVFFQKQKYMETVTIPKEEYEHLKEAHALLHDADFIRKLNRLAELLLAEKWGIVMPEDTSDLTEASIDNIAEWQTERSVWDDV
jgi:hypothetical protein